MDDPLVLSVLGLSGALMAALLGERIGKWAATRHLSRGIKMTTQRFIVVRMNYLHWGVIDLQPDDAEYPFVVENTGRDLDASIGLAQDLNERIKHDPSNAR